MISDDRSSSPSHSRSSVLERFADTCNKMLPIIGVTHNAKDTILELLIYDPLVLPLGSVVVLLEIDPISRAACDSKFVKEQNKNETTPSLLTIQVYV